MIDRTNNTHGYSLLELLIAMAVGLLVIGGVYGTYNSQQKSYKAQDEITHMRQMSRVAIALMTREIRMAGYNPTQNIAVSQFLVTTSTSLQFQIDRDGDGNAAGVDEDITYSFTNNQISRTTVNPNSTEVLAENVENLAFSYYLIGDGSGIRTVNYGTGKDDDCDGTIDEASELVQIPGAANACIAAIANSPATSAERDYIRIIEITLVIKSESPDSSYTNKYGYGNYRTVQMKSKIRPRNLGL